MIKRMRRIDIAVVTVLLLFAASLRIVGMSYGQLNPEHFPSYAPHSMAHELLPIHPDAFFSVAIPVEMSLRNRRNPEFFNYPSFVINANYLLFHLTESLNGLSLKDRVGMPLKTYAAFPLYVMSRIYSVLSGIVMVACAYAVSRIVSGRYAALCAGLLVATSFTLVTHAHYVKSSTPATAWMMLAIWACVMSLYCSSGRWRNRFYILAGVATGFAASTLYHGVSVALIVLPVGLILLYRYPSRQIRATVAIAWLAIPLCFLLASPYILRDFGHFWQDFSVIFKQYKEPGQVHAYFTVDQWTGRQLMLTYAALFGLGIAPTFMAALSIIEAWRRRPPTKVFRNNSLLLFVLLAGMLLIPYVIIVLGTVRPGHSEQLLIPVIPVLSVFSAAGAAWLARQTPLPARVTMPGVILILILQPLVLSVQVVRMFTQSDTRQVMSQWIHEKIPAGAHIFVNGPYNVALDHENYPGFQQLIGYVSSLPSGDEFDYMIYSDALAFDILRSKAIVPPEVVNEQGLYLQRLDSAYNRLAWIDRPAWTGSESMMNMAAYWHNPGLILYCLNPSSCALAP